MFDEQEKEMFRMNDFTHISYTELFGQSVRRGARKKQSPALGREYFSSSHSVHDTAPSPEEVPAAHWSQLTLFAPGW